MPLFSVIVPVYNSENCIKRCIKSICLQQFEDFEIIAVNDGSTDSSLDLLLEFAQNENRLRVINQSNGGVSSARNRGIIEAKGEYIVFCDADDYVKSNYLSSFLPESDSSALTIQYPVIYNESTNSFVHQTQLESWGTFDKEEGIYKSRLLNFGHPFGKLFEASIIKEQSLRFRDEIAYKEDLIFILEYLQHVDKIKVINSFGYIYCIHPGSLSNIWKSPENVISINSSIEELLDRLQYDDKKRYEFEKFCVAETLHLMFFSKDRYKVKVSTIKSLAKSRRTDAYPEENILDTVLKWMFNRHLYRIFIISKYISKSVLQLVTKWKESR